MKLIIIIVFVSVENGKNFEIHMYINIPAIPSIPSLQGGNDAEYK